MGSHITDSAVYGAGFASPEVAAAFSDDNRVYAVAMRTREEGDPRVAAHLAAAAIERLLEPAACVGLAPALMDAVPGRADGG
jgi:hypothetical protein